MAAVAAAVALLKAHTSCIAAGIWGRQTELLFCVMHCCKGHLLTLLCPFN